MSRSLLWTPFHGGDAHAALGAEDQEALAENLSTAELAVTPKDPGFDASGAHWRITGIAIAAILVAGTIASASSGSEGRRGRLGDLGALQEAFDYNVHMCSNDTAQIACLENGKSDTDCCAKPGEGSCLAGEALPAPLSTADTPQSTLRVWGACPSALADGLDLRPADIGAASPLRRRWSLLGPFGRRRGPQISAGTRC
mmetsp:Transcript_37919/g.109385  ORF Transcript_37919/g.109385 Transcript_37919/m.109385 type:complete len:199 (-) Transcript_37919:101-697(-)